MESFLELVDADPSGGGLPAHVRAEMERFLKCGILAHGFVRVRCSTCKDDLLVAFSCKGRGFCPSCGGRRMADTAARWVDRVLPDVPWRQWVLTVPVPLRLAMAWDPGLLTDVLTIFQRAMAGRLRLLARRKGLSGGQHASVTVVQRFGSALNLNVHLHSLVADGVWVGVISGAARFV
ncbi:MAG TPA: transposase zinc-binding domain-containing protein, partial [Myxococcota bacterium]|nr:transposase zinc-binding domain-containing protein [Myxococcota bacterium]